MAWLVDQMPVLPLLVKTKGPRGALLWEALEMPSVDGKRVLLVLLDRDYDDLSWHCCCCCWASGGMKNIATTDSLSEEDDKSALAMTSHLSIKLTKKDKQI